ncbi:MAG TPA: tetratricopeptide repeat protein, partial [Chthoniobacteraceae bacterium]
MKSMSELDIETELTIDAALDHHRAGRLDRAEAMYRQILAKQPDHPRALRLLGELARQSGFSEVALNLISRAVTLDPKCAGPYRSLAAVFVDRGKLDAAIGAYREALRIEPDSAEIRNDLGVALAAAGMLEEAFIEWRAAIRIRPDFAPAHNNLGVNLLQTGRLEEAVEACREAVRLVPGDSVMLYNLGNVLLRTGRLEESVFVYREASRLQPRGHFASLHNLGVALKEAGRFDEAIEASRQALDLSPDSAQTLCNLGFALAATGRIEEAILACRRAAAVAPNDPDVISNLLYTLHFDIAFGPADLLREHRHWSKKLIRDSHRRFDFRERDASPGRPLRIGYVSADFRSHVVGANLLALCRERDRERFEFFSYSNVRDPDAVTRELRQLCDGWREIAQLSDEKAAEMIYADRIDILVDLGLHSAQNRLPIFCSRPAPVQATYLGYCSTTGLDAIDFRLSDPQIDPPETDADYTERTIRLARSYWCYQPLGPTPGVTPLPAQTAGAPCFGCLNNSWKISDAALDLWSEILLAVPSARILLHAPPGRRREAILERWSRRGISSDQVDFVGRQSWSDYIASYQNIDVALDPFPFGGGMTTCDALWMGAPVVSLVGKTAVGRGGRSILSNLGLPELIAGTPEDYVSVAVELVGDLPRLCGLRASLRGRVEGSPLRDAQ